MKKLLFFMVLLLVSFTFAQRRTMLDVNNSSTDTLSSSATYTGEVTNALKNGNWSSIAVSAYANHSSGVDGTLTIRFGTDGTNWTSSTSYTIATDTEAQAVVFPLTSRYYQVLFVNGAELQTEFRLETILFEEDMSVGDALVTTGSANPKGNATSGYGTNTITSVEVLASSQTVKITTITNVTSGSVVYYGSDNSVTASNGQPLHYLDSKTFTRDDLDGIWLISGSSTDVRYDWEN